MRRKSSVAFDEFVRVNGDSLIRLAYLLCGDRGRAEDATQEALTKLYLRWGRIDDPLPYARRCVVNATNDHWRRSGRRERREQAAARARSRKRSHGGVERRCSHGGAVSAVGRESADPSSKTATADVNIPS